MFGLDKDLDQMELRWKTTDILPKEAKNDFTKGYDPIKTERVLEYRRGPHGQWRTVPRTYDTLYLD